MTAAARFAIYSRDYYGRMRDVLRQDYGLVAKLLGDEAWRKIADAFIVAYPSRHPNVNLYGAEFARFLDQVGHDDTGLGSQVRSENMRVLSDVARLERAVTEAPMIQDVPPLSADSLAHVEPETWAVARLVVRPSVRIIELIWPVNAMLSAHVRGEVLDLPASPSQCFVQVWRNGDATWRRELTSTRASMLKAMIDGMPLGQCVEQAAATIQNEGQTPEDAAALVQAWFAEWMADGVFAAIEIPDVGP